MGFLMIRALKLGVLGPLTVVRFLQGSVRFRTGASRVLRGISGLLYRASWMLAVSKNSSKPRSTLLIYIAALQYGPHMTPT